VTQLLVSVRSVAEAKAALKGGAALIDVKEPFHGSLGRAAEATIAAVVEFVDGRVPVSAALGELVEAPRPCSVRGLTYVKWGLAHCLQQNWREDVMRAAEAVHQLDPLCRPVVVGYADWRRAEAPEVNEVCNFVERWKPGAFLIDTWSKDGKHLLNWLDAERIQILCRRCRIAGIPIALAGSLGAEQLEHLRAAEPDWFAVRGAVCRQGSRTSAIDPRRVRALVRSLAGQPAAIGEN
jgi:uncharacterized protein (UPF0264 family)